MAGLQLLQPLDAELRRDVAVVVGEDPVHRDRQLAQGRHRVEAAAAGGAHLRSISAIVPDGRLAFARRAAAQ